MVTTTKPAAPRKTKQAASATSTTTRTRKAIAKPEPKRYVLDTNVLLHDPTALFRFDEHDVYIPLVVLEELDRHKKGVADLARNARQVTRSLDALLESTTGSMEEGFPLDEASNGIASGRLFFRDSFVNSKSGPVPRSSVAGLEEGKPDNLILQCAQELLSAGNNAILVTKDINLRVKAMACGVPAQDFRSDRVFSDEDVLPPGFLEIESSFWAAHSTSAEPFTRRAGRQYARITKPLTVNSFLVEEAARKTRLWRVESNSPEGSVLYQVTPSDRPALLEVRNNEQALAVSLLHDKEIDFVAMLGPAGTGKTLLAVAAGLGQVKEGRYNEVLITRATVPMGEEIGFLPGTELEKMDPWIGGTLRDVYTVLGLNDPKDPLRQKVEVASMSFMRGRSFQGKFIIIDEAQNLTIGQMRALLTRAGEGSKVVLTGNLGQIDSPYIDEGSSGLAWAVKTMQDWPHAGSLILTRGERSRLATYVEEAASRASREKEGGLLAA